MTQRRFSRRRRSFRRGPRRQVAWTVLEHRPSVMLPGAASASDLTPELGASVLTSAGGPGMPTGVQREGMSIARMIIDGAVFLPDPGAVDSATLWIGVVKVEERSFALNAWPRPGQDDGDWLYLNCVFVAHRSAVTSGFDPMDSMRIHYDSPASRRLDSGNEKLAVITANDTASVGSVDVELCFRILWRLS